MQGFNHNKQPVQQKYTKRIAENILSPSPVNGKYEFISIKICKSCFIITSLQYLRQVINNYIFKYLDMFTDNKKNL